MTGIMSAEYQHELRKAAAGDMSADNAGDPERQ
jgi:hypothetical protein